MSDVYSANDDAWGKPFRTMLDSCKPIPVDDTPDKDGQDRLGTLCESNRTGGAQTVLPAAAMLVMGAFAAVIRF